jgi:membrane-bound lytic murein transglycosylase B
VGILTKFSLIFIVLLAFIVCSSPVLGQVAPDFEARKEIISQKLKDSGFNDDEISSVFSDARIALHPEILDRTGKGFNYLSRKFGLLTKKSIVRGQRVLAENREAFREIEKKYGV